VNIEVSLQKHFATCFVVMCILISLYGERSIKIIHGSNCAPNNVIIEYLKISYKEEFCD
jgi:hypothetical protein